MKKITVFADFDFLATPQEIGILDYERIRGNDHFAFKYSSDWLKSSGGIILSGDLMNVSSQQHPRELYRRVAFNVLFGNTDDHFRNHGFLLTATSTPFFCLRSLPWWDRKLEGLNSTTTYKTGYDCGMGNQQRSFMLPPEAIGAKSVVIKLTPARATLSITRSSPSDDVSGGTYAMTPSVRNISMIRIGEISIDYR